MPKDISGYIRELLFKHDCVIIPGFGAFIGNYFPARADRREGLFMPPSRKITFNRHLTGNDGLLIGHVSSGLGTGYGEARDIVLEWADVLRRRIMTGTPLTIDHLGTFSLNYEGAIVFEPDTTVNYLLSSYGLSAYHRQPVTGFDVRKRALEKRHVPPVSEPSVRNLLTRAAVIIPVLVALALVPFNDRLFKGNLEESTLNPLARAELEFNREQIDAGKTAAAVTGEEAIDTMTLTTPSVTSPVVVKETLPPVQTPIEEPPVTSPVIREEPPQSAPAASETVTQSPPPATAKAITQPTRPSRAVVVEEYRYLIIIGSFQGEDNALVMVEKLRKLGYDPEVAGGPDGFLRVSAKSFATLDEAKIGLGEIVPKFPGSWVYKSGSRQ
jgi:cell division septation protein DedD